MAHPARRDSGGSIAHKRRLLMSFAAIFLSPLLFSGVASRAAEPREVTVQTDWFADMNQGGFWQAEVDQPLKSKGIHFTVRAGGPKIQTIPQVAAGQADFGISNADDLMIARSRGAPVKAVFAFLDYTPYALFYHGEKVKSVSDLSGRTFAVAIGAAYWDWVKKKAGFQSVREIPLSGDLSLFRTNPSLVQQGFSVLLPYRFREAGIDFQELDIASLGYRPYRVIFATDQFIANNKALLGEVLAAFKDEWKKYKKDPSAAQARILSLDDQLDAKIFRQSYGAIVKDLMPSDDAKIGCMTDARWKELVGQLKDINLVPASFDYKTAVADNMVPDCN